MGPIHNCTFSTARKTFAQAIVMWEQWCGKSILSRAIQTRCTFPCVRNSRMHVWRQTAKQYIYLLARHTLLRGDEFSNSIHPAPFAASKQRISSNSLEKLAGYMACIVVTWWVATTTTVSWASSWPSSISRVHDLQAAAPGPPAPCRRGVGIVRLK